MPITPMGILGLTPKLTLLGKGINAISKVFGDFGRITKAAIKKSKDVNEATTESVKKLGNILQNITKIPGISSFLKLLSQLMGGAIAPGLTAFMEAMERIGEILGIILIPLKPFLDLLSIISQVLEAALAPMLATIYSELQPVIEGLVEMIPELTEAVTDWLESDNGLMEAIKGIVESLPELLIGLVSIIPLIGQLAVIFAKELLPALIQLIPDFITLALIFARDLLTVLPEILPDLMEMVKAFLQLFTALAPLAGPLSTIISVLSNIIGMIMGAWVGFMIGGPIGAAVGAAMGVGLDLFRALGTAEGGIFTEPTLRIIGEAGPEKVVPLEDEEGGGSIVINFNGSVIGDDDLIDGLINEIQRRKMLGMI